MSHGCPYDQTSTQIRLVAPGRHQRYSETQLTYPAARAAARWKHHAGNSPIHGTSSRSTSQQHPTAINPRAAEDNIWFQESLSIGQQLVNNAMSAVLTPKRTIGL